MNNKIKIGLAQITPKWLDKKKTVEKAMVYIKKAALESCNLLVFGEALVPGYPFWLEYTNGASFNNEVNKKIHAHYVRNAVCIENGDLDELCTAANQYNIAIYLGCIERPLGRGAHSVYCSLVFIDREGTVQSVHRKLRPTHEERLCWSPGDGHGLRVHALGNFTVGGLNCWENWMPLSRSALYALGEDLHIAVWPGSARNTQDITRFIAKESRSFVVSVSAMMRKSDFYKEIPYVDLILEKCPDILADGGSCVAGPDGEWILEPVVNKEGLYVVELDHNRVLEERQNFDASGHYSRPDVTELLVNRTRQKIAKFYEKE